MNLFLELSKQRRKQGVSQAHLAFSIGVETSTLQRWEMCSRTPSLHNLLSWVESLGLTLTLIEKKITETKATKSI